MGVPMESEGRAKRLRGAEVLNLGRGGYDCGLGVDGMGADFV